MPASINLPVLLAQLPHLSKLTSIEQARPDVQAELSERLARAEELRRKSSVEETEKTKHPKPVDDEKQGGAQHRQSMRQKNQQQENEEEDAKAPSKNPWAGNIISTKI